VKKALSILVVLTAGLLLTGCPSLWSTAATEKTENAERLYKDAEAAFESKDYDKAIELYERVKSGYTDFEKMPEVYLKLAEAFYKKGDYDKAVSRYQQFGELYPGNKDVPKAKFYAAMGYFQQSRSPDLDNRIVRTAADAFKALRDDPQAGEWAQKAGEKYNECLKKMAEKELYKARTYVSMGKYKAARIAAKRVLDEYKETGFDKEAEDLIKGIKGK
jgi:outer membrane protein assembly factor BamD